jgi:polysaccharide biosynthesis PFTS motif protein
LLTSINQYILNNKKIKSPTIFISKRYRKIIQGNSELFDTRINVKFEPYWGVLKLKAIWFAIVFGYTLHLLIQPFCRKTTNKKIFKYAISIPWSWAVKFKGARDFPFLVDDNSIKNNETVFLVEYQESNEFYQKYSNAGYNLRQATNVRQIRNLFSTSNLDTRHEFPKIIRLLKANKEDFFIYEAIASMLISRISWSIITSKIKFKNYIYYNKEAATQIAANIFLKKKNISVHAYSQFIGGPYQVSGKNSIYDKRNIHWSFLNPNYFYLNNQAMLDSMHLHYHGSVIFKNIGNIFSEKILEIKRNIKSIKEIKLNFNIQNQHKVISIFDTTYVNISKAYSNYDEAQYFLKDIIKLAKSMPNHTFLLKPSKDNSFFLPKSSFWAGEKGIDIIQLREKFNQLPNAIILSDNADVVDIISLSDVVFTNCFSSPTADALMANVPAFWYQSKTDISFSPYNKIAGLVINGFENLNTCVNKMLKSDYDLNFLKNPEFIYLVGDSSKKALTLLREGLSGE